MTTVYISSRFWRLAETIEFIRKGTYSVKKLENWWFYYKWHFLIGIFIVIAFASLVHDMLGVGKTEPDYQMAYVGADPLPEDTVHALENAISEIGQDLNGDGQVVVAVNQYATYENIIQTQNRVEEIGDGDLAMQAEASYVGLMTDISAGDSFFFLLDDPENFEQTYEILSYIDGTLPAEGDYADKQVYIAWSDSPLLTGLDLGEYDQADAAGNSQELLSELYIARRGYWTDKVSSNLEGCEALWRRFLEGVN